MATVYVPDEMIDEVKLMKRYRRQGRKYYITLDFKEESRNEEKLPPCTPFSKEEKKKEERREGKTSACAEEVEGKKNNIPVYLNPPTLEEVKAFFEIGDFTMVTAEEFYQSSSEAKWKFKRGNPIRNWQRAAQDLERWRREHNWNPTPANHSSATAPTSQPETFAEKKHKLLVTGESRMMEDTVRQIAEREERLRKQASESCSYAEYERMKREGRV